MVLFGLVMAWRLAGSPTLRSPFSTNATMEGVVRLPSLFEITTGSLPSMTATQELVVPKSIPIIFDILLFLIFNLNCYFQLNNLQIQIISNGLTRLVPSCNICVVL